VARDGCNRRVRVRLCLSPVHRFFDARLVCFLDAFFSFTTRYFFAKLPVPVMIPVEIRESRNWAEFIRLSLPMTRSIAC
jgi:hypothetical protein